MIDSDLIGKNVVTISPSVLFLDHTAQLGGAELCLLDLCSNVPDAEVLLLADGPFSQSLRDVGVEVRLSGQAGIDSVRRGGGLISGLRALSGVWRSVLEIRAHLLDGPTGKRGEKFELLYANSLKSLIVGGLAGRLAGVPVVWHLHDILSREHFSGINIKVVVACANRLVAQVIANSEASRKAFVDAGGCEKRVSVVYNGLDASVFHSVKTELPKKNESEDLMIAGCFGRLSPWKGQDVFIRAIAKTPGVEGWIVGEALFGEDAYAEELHRLVDDLGISDRIRFMGFRSDIPDLMGRCDVVVHCSSSPEPFGRVIAEGMLAGAAVIAADAGGARELVRHDDTGLLFEPGTSGALSQALRRFRDDVSMRLLLARRGRDWAYSNVSLKVVWPMWWKVVCETAAFEQNQVAVSN